MNVLIVAAHPDDEVLGCGGTIARLSEAGHAVYIAILGEGITSRYADRAEARQEELYALHTNCRRAAELLGAADLFIHDLPDNRFDTVPLLEIVKCIETLVDRLQPEVVYTQHGGDLNIDHAATFRATLTATRTLAGCPVQRLYAYEVPSSTEVAFAQFAPAFQPNVFVDIEATLERKIQAMEVYESERRVYPHPRSSEALRAIARKWGSTAGFAAAEAFQLIREIQPHP